MINNNNVYLLGLNQKDKLFVKKRLMKQYQNKSASLIGIQTPNKNTIGTIETIERLDQPNIDSEIFKDELKNNKTTNNEEIGTTIDRLNDEYEIKYKNENLECLNPDAQFNPYIIVRWEKHYLKVPYKKSP